MPVFHVVFVYIRLAHQCSFVLSCDHCAETFERRCCTCVTLQMIGACVVANGEFACRSTRFSPSSKPHNNNNNNISAFVLSMTEEADYVFEIPFSLKRLARVVARAFYSIEDALIVDMFVRYPCECSKQTTASFISSSSSVLSGLFSCRYQGRGSVRPAQV